MTTQGAGSQPEETDGSFIPFRAFTSAALGAGCSLSDVGNSGAPRGSLQHGSPGPPPVRVRLFLSATLGDFLTPSVDSVDVSPWTSNGL